MSTQSKAIQSITLTVPSVEIPADMHSMFHSGIWSYTNKTGTFSKDFKFYRKDRDIKYLEGNVADAIAFLQGIQSGENGHLACLDYEYGSDGDSGQMILQEWKSLTPAQTKTLKAIHKKQLEDRERLLIDRAQAEIERATEILRKAGKL